MAVWPKRVNVGTTATRVDDAETALNITVTMCNRSANSIFVGGAAVTTSTGFELMPGDMITFRMAMNAGGVYAIAATAGNRLDRIQVSS